MVESQRKYDGSLTLEALKVAIDSHEQLFGGLTALEALGAFTVATFSDEDFPPLRSLALLPASAAAMAPPGSVHLCDGAAMVLGANLSVSAYRLP